MLTNDRMFSPCKCSNKVYLIKEEKKKKTFFESNFKNFAYSMTNFGGEMVKFIDTGLRRLDSLIVIL